MPINRNCKNVKEYGRGRPWPDDLCARRPRDCSRRGPSTQAVQDRLRMKTLQSEVVELRNLLLAHIDPEDMQAAAELKRIMPSTAALLALAATCGPPPCLENEPDEERPW